MSPRFPKSAECAAAIGEATSMNLDKTRMAILATTLATWTVANGHAARPTRGGESVEAFERAFDKIAIRDLRHAAHSSPRISDIER